MGLDAGWTAGGTGDEAAAGIVAGEEVRCSCAGEGGDEYAGVDEELTERVSAGEEPDALGGGSVTKGTACCMDGNP